MKIENWVDKIDAVMACYVTFNGEFTKMSDFSNETGLSRRSIGYVFEILIDKGLADGDNNLFPAFVGLSFPQAMNRLKEEEQIQTYKDTLGDFFQWCCYFAYMFDYFSLPKSIGFHDGLFLIRDRKDWPAWVQPLFLDRTLVGLVQHKPGYNIRLIDGHWFASGQDFGPICDAGKGDLLKFIFLEERGKNKS